MGNKRGIQFVPQIRLVGEIRMNEKCSHTWKNEGGERVCCYCGKREERIGEDGGGNGLIEFAVVVVAIAWLPIIFGYNTSSISVLIVAIHLILLLCILLSNTKGVYIYDEYL